MQKENGSFFRSVKESFFEVFPLESLWAGWKMVTKKTKTRLKHKTFA
jgi:hypothetical protein